MPTPIEDHIEELKTILRRTMDERGMGEERIPHGLIYHYTSASGLKGILQGKSIFATHSAYLNDSSEMQYGDDLGTQLLLARLKDEHTQVFDGLVTIADTYAMLEHERSELEVLRKRYVAVTGRKFYTLNYAHDSMTRFFPAQGKASYITSFCENGDLLSQWRGYANRGGGYAIGVSITRSQIETDGGIFGAFKIIYEGIEQQVSLDKLLQNALEHLNCYQFPEMHNAEFVEICKRHAIVLTWFLKLACARFKNNAFSEEKEWRFFAQKKENDSEAMEFREANGLLIPYLRFPIEADGIEVKRIVCGPTLHPKLSKHSVELLAQNSKYGELEIVNSKIPLNPF